MAERIALLDLTQSQLAELLADWGEPRYRAEQVWRWLYRDKASDPASMSNLPAALRARLNAETDLRPLVPLVEQASPSGLTRKVLFGLHDGVAVESVLMVYRGRRTACISTQAGCAMGCVFCATGQQGLVRNLSPGEIVAQVLHFSRQAQAARPGESPSSRGAEDALGPAISNVVLMGMGEPLANYAATWQAIETLADPRGYCLGARRITLSTVGLIPGIRRLTDEDLPVNLAVSLHAADDILRSELVPLNRRYPLGELMAAVRDYVERTGRRVTFEYALIDSVNDQPEQAVRLASLVRGVLCHVNLIALNPTAGSVLRPSPRETVDAFRDRLGAAGVPTTVRLRRGIEIEAGCGQLRQRYGGYGTV